MWFFNLIHWLQAFVAPVILFGMIGIAIGIGTVLYVLLGAGFIAGIIVAEYIRRKIGLDTFFGRIYGPNKMDKKLNDQRD